MAAAITPKRPAVRKYLTTIRLLSDAGLLVYGRKTYQLMVPYWPDVLKDQSASIAGGAAWINWRAGGRNFHYWI